MFEIIYLLVLGFIVGISGAIIPGPLLVYTISESIKKGKWTGFKVILGHAIVEILILTLIILGVSSFMTNTYFVKTVSLLGGIFLIYMAYHLYKTKFSLETQKDFNHTTIFGGIVFTAFNPSFPVWWATLGSKLVLEGFTKAGNLGAIIVVVGHWIADFGYFILVSMAVAHESKKLFEGKKIIFFRKILSTILLIIGIYFIYTVK